MPKRFTSFSPLLFGRINRCSTTYDYSIPDPPLTLLGETQCRSIPSKYPSLFTAAPLLVASPLRRTLTTALLGFNRPPLPHPGFQENSAKPCDTGSPPSILRNEFPGLDFGLVSEGWDSKKGEYAADEATLAARATRMRQWLKEQEENEIIVVTHGGMVHCSAMFLHVLGFLMYLVQEIQGFENTECRTYTFADTDEAILIPLEGMQKEHPTNRGYLEK